MSLSPLPFELGLLQTLVAVSDNGGFTRAGHRLGLTQSTVSLQIKKLEKALGCKVFSRERGWRGGEPRATAEGEILLNYARQILRLCDEASSRLLEPDVKGTVRLGTPEDFATVHLPHILARFAQAHPRVALEVNCDFTLNLLEGFSRGEYDLVLFKREPQGTTGGLGKSSPADGVGLWREVLVWAASPKLVLDHKEPLPLVLAPTPDVYRKRALASLDAAGRAWRIVYSSPSLAGLQAAVGAGLGITVLPKGMVPAGFIIMGQHEHALPELPDTELVLYKAPGTLPRSAELLAEHITHSLENHPG